MKKSNKILMATVAILLSLVLISTSLVSGIFAKFVVRKDATVKVTFKDYGVTLDVFGATGTDSDIDVIQPDGSSATVTLKGINMQPGDVKDKILNLAFDGTLTMASDLTIKVKVDLDEKFIIPADDFSSLDTDTAYMPIIFKVGAFTGKNAMTDLKYDVDGDGVADYATERLFVTESTAYDGDILEQLESDLQDAICNSISDGLFKDSLYTIKKDAENASYIEPIIFTNSAFFNDTMNGFSLGFEWPMGKGVGEDGYTAADGLTNDIETYLVEQFGTSDVPITITITFMLEQR